MAGSNRSKRTRNPTQKALANRSKAAGTATKKTISKPNRPVAAPKAKLKLKSTAQELFVQPDDLPEVVEEEEAQIDVDPFVDNPTVPTHEVILELDVHLDHVSVGIKSEPINILSTLEGDYNYWKDNSVSLARSY